LYCIMLSDALETVLSDRLIGVKLIDSVYLTNRSSHHVARR
jgi:hypothetical protein